MSNNQRHRERRRMRANRKAKGNNIERSGRRDERVSVSDALFMLAVRQALKGEPCEQR